MKCQTKLKYMKNQESIQALVDAVRDGLGDPLETMVEFREMIEIYTEASKQIKPMALNELLKYGREGKTVDGYHLTVKNTGDRLDYSKDTEWNNLTLAAKARATIVKGASQSSGEVFDGDGVLVESVPVKTHGQETLNFKAI